MGQSVPASAGLPESAASAPLEKEPLPPQTAPWASPAPPPPFSSHPGYVVVLIITSKCFLGLLGASPLTYCLVPIIQNENRVASIAISTASSKHTVISATITRGPSPQTPRGSLSNPNSAIESPGVASNDTIPPSDTPIAQPSSTTKSLSISTIFAIALSAAAFVAVVLSFTWFCRRSPPTPRSVKNARYLRKRRPLRPISNAWSAIEPIVIPDNDDELTATLHPPEGVSTPAASAPPQRRLSGFRIPRKAPPRLPSWALSTPPGIPETRPPEPFLPIPDPVLVRGIPSATVNTHQPRPI